MNTKTTLMQAALMAAAMVALPLTARAAGAQDNASETQYNIAKTQDNIAGAQDSTAGNRVEATIGADIVSRYVWRGQDLGKVSLQPTASLAYRGLSLSAWGNVGLSQPDDDEEIVLTLMYEHKSGLRVSLTDYWTAYSRHNIEQGEVSDPHNRYFSYGAHNTNHVFEASVGYDCGLFSIDWFTNIGGDDTRTDGGHRAYSSYVEANVPFEFASCSWTATVGAVPYKTAFYDTAGGFAVVNVSLMAEKSIALTPKFSLPLFAGIAANPSNRAAYMVFGMTVAI